MHVIGPSLTVRKQEQMLLREAGMQRYGDDAGMQGFGDDAGIQGWLVEG